MNNSKEFKKLQAEWDKKLKDSGFNDAEQRKDENLKNWSCLFSTKHTPVQAEAKYEYYRACGHFLHEYKFSEEAERRMFQLHSEGVSMRGIVKVLTQEKCWFKRGHRPCKFTVQTVLKRLTSIMLQKIEDSNAAG